MKTWNVGNTTVRNPQRVRAGLQVFADHFAGRPWDAEAEERFHAALVDAGVFSPTGGAVKATSRGQTGRKWASAFKQLGLAKVGRRLDRVELTAVGQELLQNEAASDDIFLRQLLKYHLPSPLEPRTKKQNFSVHPFRLTLRIMNELQRRGSPGLTKEELALFVVTTIDDAGESDAVRRILSYRAQRDAVKGRVAKMRLFGQKRLEVARELYAGPTQTRYQEKHDLLHALMDAVGADEAYLGSAEADEALSEIVRSGKGYRTLKAQDLKRLLRAAIRDGRSEDQLWGMVSGLYLGTRGRSLIDYADTAARYFSMSGLFSVAGTRLVLRESFLPLVDRLVADGYPTYAESQYVEAYFDPHEPALPSDDAAVLRDMLLSLQSRQAKLAVSLGIEAPEPVAPPLRAADLKREVARTREHVGELRELQFYREQAQSPNDILGFFDDIKNRSLFGGDTYYPAFYEWNIWRVFLAINEIRNDILETRGFKVDEGMYPVHHAAPGRPDMLFEYDDCALVVEATLSMGENQWSQEQEPVQRHVKDVMRLYPGRRVCGVFVAPRIDPNTAVNFRIARGWMDGKETPLDVVPLTTDQLISILKWQHRDEYNTTKLLALIQDLSALRDAVQDGVAWLAAISRTIEARTVEAA